MQLSNGGSAEQVVCLDGHGHIIEMEPTDFVGDPDDFNPTPVQKNTGVMELGFSQFSHLVGKGKGLLEVFECKDPSQLFNTIRINDIPVRDLGFEGRQLTFCEGRGISVTVSSKPVQGSDRNGETSKTENVARRQPKEARQN